MTDTADRPSERRSHVGRVSEAYGQLRELILTNRLPAGAPIIEARAAKHLGYTRLTLRSALQRLQQEGYVYAAQLGTYTRSIVAPLTVADMMELFEITGAVEGLAARHVAALEPAEREAVGRELAAMNERLLRSVEEPSWNPDLAFQLDYELHHAIVDRVGGRLLRQYEATRPQTERYRRLYTTRGPERMRTGFHEHEPILAAIAAGDADRAEHAVRTHYQNAADRLRPAIEELGEVQRLGG